MVENRDDAYSDRPVPPDGGRDSGEQLGPDASSVRSIRKEPEGLDALFVKTPLWVFGVGAFCTGPLALGLGVLGLFICEHEGAKARAFYASVVGAASTGLAIFISCAGG